MIDSFWCRISHKKRFKSSALFFALREIPHWNEFVCIPFFSRFILSEDGTVNLNKLSQIVFTDPEKLKVLNKLIHPRVRQDLKQWFDKNKDTRIGVYESALLFESGLNKEMDYSISVSCPVELSIDRVIKRSQLSEPEILLRMKNQYSDSKKSKYADFIIINDEKTLLIPQILKVLDEIKSKNLH